MSSIQLRASQQVVRGAERALEVRLGALGGFELRPTRLFVWSGEEREATQRIVSLGSEPRSLDIPRKEQELRVGGIEVRSLGNPLLTIALAGVHALRRLAAEGPTEPGSSGRA